MRSPVLFLCLSSVCLLHLPCICSHWLSLTLLQVAWLSFGFASALLRLAFAFLWLCLCLAWLHSGFVLDFVFVLLRVAVASLKMWFDVGLRLGSAWLAIFLARKFRVDSASALGPNCPLGATLSVCLSMCLLIFSSVCLFVCLSIYLSIDLLLRRLIISSFLRHGIFPVREAVASHPSSFALAVPGQSCLFC